ncbi:nucleoside-diphosphate sugar epimerase [bacterium Unc6]|nr:nucleoside-diphosphate sugar epimerase [bacterium Unc6]
MPKVLITGGAGFIGSHLAERLVKDLDEVFILDDLSTGSKLNIEHLIGDRCHFFHDTIFNHNLLSDLIQSVDVIYHFAASVGVCYVLDHPLKSLQINVQGTENILDIVSTFNKKVFIASSSEIYGKNEKVPLSEDDDRILGSTRIFRWSYACSKTMDEFLVAAYRRERGLKAVIGRFFNICGPRQTGRYGMVIPRFIEQALSEKPITVYGDGEQIRTFTYVCDAIEATVGLMNTEKAESEIFNIGSSEPVRIKELAEIVKEITKSNSEIIYIPYEKAYEKDFEDMRCRVPDITKIQRTIDYKPKYDLKKMIQEILKDLH